MVLVFSSASLRFRYSRLLVTPLLIINALLLALWLLNDVFRDSRGAGRFAYLHVPKVPRDELAEVSDLVGSDIEGRGTPLPPPSGLAGQGRGREGCGYCGPDDLICKQYGEYNLARSRAYEGANARLTRVLENAREGQPLKIGIIGGPITSGHGVSYQDNWATLFFKSFNHEYPNGHNQFINGALPTGTSGYYSTCFLEHIPEDVDLVIIELSTEDPRNEETAHEYELLLHGLLDLPHRPAVINAQVIGLDGATISTAGDIHLSIAQYYDVPTISLRNVLLQHIFQHPEQDQELFIRNPDGNPNWKHINDRGHRMLADFLMSFINRQSCVMRTMMEEYMEWTYTGNRMPEFGDVWNDIPPLSMFQEYGRGAISYRDQPTCMAAGKALIPIENHGWNDFLSTDEGKRYLRALEPGARVTFGLDMIQRGVIRVTYLRSTVRHLGDAACWVDNDRSQQKVLKGWSNVPQLDIPITETITTTAAPGAHRLHCEVLQTTSDPNGRHEFRLISVASI